MGRTSYIKVDDQYNNGRPLEDAFAAKVRLNLDDQLKKRKEEKRIDKKNRLLIFSGAVALVVVVGAILSL